MVDAAWLINVTQMVEAASSAGHLRSLVSLWLGASHRGDTRATPGIEPWFNWSAPIPDQFSALPLPARIVHHPWSGCAASPICYPSPSFLENLLSDFENGVGEVIVDIGPFLGESTVGLAQALQARGVLSSSTRVLAIDHWREHTGYTGGFLRETTWTPPAPIAADVDLLKSTPPPLYWQFVRNVNASSYQSYVQPLPLWEEARAMELGRNVSRPKLVYVNPPRHAATLRHDIVAGWRLLACGGTMAGVGYHLPVVHSVLNAFMRHLGDRQPALELHVVHAPGAAKFENISHPFSEEALIANSKSNFSTWAIRGKRCIGTSSDDDEIIIQHDEI